jgi:dipeptidyl aminopeptidase/acylaminoacyl peptidase
MPHRFEQYFAVRRFHYLSSLSFSPDGAEIAYSTDTTGQFNLWRQPAAGGWPVQLTVLEDDSARQHAWTREGFVVGIDHHGDEQWQLHRLPASGGWPEDLTRHPGAQFVVGYEHPDRPRLTYSGNATRPEDTSVYELDLVSGESHPLVEDRGNFAPGPWHPDGRRLALVQVLGNMDQDVFLLDLADGSRRHLTPHQGEEINLPVGFSQQGDALFLLTNRDHEFTWLARLDLAGGLETVWRGDWDVEAAHLDRERRRLAWVVNEGGLSAFHVLDLVSGRELGVPELPRGWCRLSAFSPDGRRLAAVISTATRTADVYVADLEAQTTTRLTWSFLGGIPEEELCGAEAIHYPSFDRRIPAWLYLPRAAGRLPVVLSIHGGPEAQERPGQEFSLYQYLASRGVAVLAPNIRGSSGYGRTYQALIHRDWGGGELRDIEAAARWLQEQAWVDPHRIAVYGASFGGFATLSAMTRLSEYWACGVDLVGPSNLVTFARAVPPHWKHWTRRWVGDPDDDRDLLVERSPITYVDRVRAPLLVLQGARDPRVVKAESDQMVERLRAMGREVEYQVFEDEGHGFTKRPNLLRAYRMIADFLLRHLGVEGA